MLSEGEECLLGTVAGGAEAIGAEPHPCEEGDQRQAVEEPRVANVLRFADDQIADRLLDRDLFLCSVAILIGIHFFSAPSVIQVRRALKKMESATLTILFQIE